MRDEESAMKKIGDPRKALAEIRAAFGLAETHALYNLEGAIIDIERQGKADAISMRTLKRVSGQLAHIKIILDAAK